MPTTRTGTVNSTTAPGNFLSTIEIFARTPVEALREIEKRMVEKKYRRNESIVLEGDKAEFVWFVKEGHVKAMVHTVGGRTQTLCMVGSRGMFGSCCCFGGGDYPCHSMAETDVTVVRIPMVDFLSLLDRYPQVSKAFAADLSKRLRHSKDTRVHDQERVEKRILHVLVDMVKEFGTTIPLTKREIAEIVGTTVETCIRTFSILEAEGLVVTKRGQIAVKRVQDLNKRLEAA